MLLIVFFADLFELLFAIAVVVPVLGQALIVVRFFGAFVVWFSIQLWLILKGVKGLWFAAGGILDMLTNLMAFDIPFGKTLTLLITIYLANHPKIAAIATKIKPGKTNTQPKS